MIVINDKDASGIRMILTPIYFCRLRNCRFLHAGQTYNKFAAAIGPPAAGGDRPPMHIYQLPDQCEPYSQPTLSFLPGSVQLIKRLMNMVDMLRENSNSSVGDPDQNRLRVRFDRNGDASPVFREF